MMEKRILLAVSLSFIVLVVYQSLLPTPPPGDPELEQRTTAARDASDVAAPSARPPSSAVSTPAEPALTGGEATPTSAEPLLPSVEPAVGAIDEQTTTIETPHVRVTFSNRGGVVVSWQLKEFLSTGGIPEELVPQDLAGAVHPFSLGFEDPEVEAELGRALFRTTVNGLAGPTDSGSVIFDYDNGAGLRARKEFNFEPEQQPYVVTFSAAVDHGGRALQPAVRWGPGLADTPIVSRYAQVPQAIFYQDGDTTRVGASDLGETPVREGLFSFLGIDDHYFTSVVLPESRPLRAHFETTTQPSTVPDQEPVTLVAYDVSVADGPASNLAFFVGPKSFDTLEAVHPDLVRAIDFGIFSFLAVPLLRALKWINVYVGNYGWSIIILTVLINAAMFPLRHKSVVSMRKMQEIQPEVKAIQDRYSKLKTTDPARQKMNAELMNLYRERGVNPASGCLPMLLTMPVLFAFYSLLSVAIEIRGAPFIFWITDLSAHDPFYVTPVVMGVSMVYQQMKTPSTADPTQQKVMMFMPVMFTFMFLWASSGLVLYWLCSNLWGIGQQAVTNRIIGPPVVKTVRPPAERRVKKSARAKASGDQTGDKK